MINIGARILRSLSLPAGAQLQLGFREHWFLFQIGKYVIICHFVINSFELLNYGLFFYETSWSGEYYMSDTV